MGQKKAPPYSGPALVEANLPDYDKAELAAERALRNKVEECKDAAKVAKEQLEKLGADQKALDKKAPDYKSASQDINAKIKALQGVASKRCKLTHLGCVPQDNSTRVSMPVEITDDINKEFNANIDFAQLSKWEGGAFKKAYIPWWPYIDKDDKATVMAMSDSTSGKVIPRLKGELNNKPNNRSGATIGIGVDLGQETLDGFFNKLDLSNKRANAIPAAELAALKEKIRPYFNMQGGDACKYLNAHPLILTDQQVIFLNKAAHEDALATAKRTYKNFAEDMPNATKKFSDLSQIEQTTLISNGYQYGSPQPDLMKALVLKDRTKMSSDYREFKYLSNSFPQVKP